GDTLYGHNKQRVALQALNVQVVAPVVKTPNPSGLYDISLFTYNHGKDVYTCPNNKETVRKARNKALEGSQHFFAPEDCQGCPLKKSCTKSASRSIFHSDHYDLQKTASTFNKSPEGKELHLRRFI